VASVERRGGRGTAQAIAAVLTAPHPGTGIKTAASERLHATFRPSLAPLVRRGRAIAHPQTARTAGMSLVGWAYTGGWRPERWRGRRRLEHPGRGRSVRQRWQRA
jgi:hypothetical protein